MAKERRLRYPLLWLGFIVLMIAGATLVSSPSGGLQALGLALILGPVLLLAAVTLAYYLVERFRASR
ncbi:MAG: hypothetical protein V4510_09505 [bacterium]